MINNECVNQKNWKKDNMVIARKDIRDILGYYDFNDFVMSFLSFLD